MSADEAARGKLIGVKGVALAEATATNRAIDSTPTMAAIDRYTGVLYDALDVGSLAGAERRRLDAQVLIMSGVWGLVAPRDPIPDYKCKMGASLPGIGVLSTWWRDRLTPVLDDRARRRTTWNLLPNEHATVWRPRVPSRQIAVRFLDPVGGRLTTVSHWNKLLKGSLVRWILTTQADSVDSLDEFVHPLGYRWRPDLDVTVGQTTTVSLVRTDGP